MQKGSKDRKKSKLVWTSHDMSRQALEYLLKGDRSGALHKITVSETCPIVRISGKLLKNTDSHGPSQENWTQQVWGWAWESVF